MWLVKVELEKDMRLMGREFQRRGKKLQKERSENVSLEVRDGSGDRIGRGARLTSRFDTDKIAQLVG